MLADGRLDDLGIFAAHLFGKSWTKVRAVGRMGGLRATVRVEEGKSGPLPNGLDRNRIKDPLAALCAKLSIS